jgi:hypothetical protein
MSFLEEDMLKVSGQNYALISVVSKDSNQKAEVTATKIRGVFNTIEEAQEWAKRLHKIDPNYDIHLVELYKWLLLPPPKDTKQEFMDEKLNEIIKGYEEQQDQAKEVFNERQRKLVSGDEDIFGNDPKQYKEESEE